MYHQIAI